MEERLQRNARLTVEELGELLSLVERGREARGDLPGSRRPPWLIYLMALACEIPPPGLSAEVKARLRATGYDVRAERRVYYGLVPLLRHTARGGDLAAFDAADAVFVLPKHEEILGWSDDVMRASFGVQTLPAGVWPRLQPYLLRAHAAGRVVFPKDHGRVEAARRVVRALLLPREVSDALLASPDLGLIAKGPREAAAVLAPYDVEVVYKETDL